MDSKIVSVNIARPAEFQYRGRPLRTGIFKEPVDGTVSVGALGLAGDFQVDHRYHGGPRKAVYTYPAEHYEYWRQEFPDRALPFGTFGENLTTTGLLEDDLHVGDQLRIGTVILEATQPRTPCFKLALKFGTPTMIKRFLASSRPGIYFKVIQAGELSTGTPIERLTRNEHNPTIRSVILKS